MTPDHSPLSTPDTGLTLAGALANARKLGLDRLDAQRLLAHTLQRPRTWLLAHDDEALPAAQSSSFALACQRRADGEPLAYIIGEREFHGLPLTVTPAVLDPRADTEVLVDWALALLPSLGSAPVRVLDLGTGSGAIALAVAHRHPAAQVTATDISAAALAVAQGNADKLGLSVITRLGPWWQALPQGQTFDLVLSNPPYIAGDDPHLPALRHEPLEALTPGGDGLDALRAIIAGASTHLAPGAWLLLEHGWDQAEAVNLLLGQAGFSNIQTRHDIAQHARCTGGCWHPEVASLDAGNSR